MQTLTKEDWAVFGREPATPKQLRMLKAVCGCLADQILWHGRRMSRDGWRWFLSGIALNYPPTPGYDKGDGMTCVVMLGASSKELTKTAASEAITIGLHIGDAPHDQNLQCDPVRWSDTVLLGLGYNPNDFRSAA